MVKAVTLMIVFETVEVVNEHKKGDVNIHWFSILNSVIIIIFLFAIISIIIVKTIRRDINQVSLSALPRPFESLTPVRTPVRTNPISVQSRGR